MRPGIYYNTVTEAIKQLREKGFTMDFNLEENCIACHPDKFSALVFHAFDVPA
jgi:hypothetical protein